ncbi:MAG TPA: DeoR family transcriptional regulator [Pseudogracilibacillus sp.]|nr:DeoR family transcriptional regulator [Pseudogracilibacillus sp.]
MTKNLDEKKAIAKYAASLVQHGDCLYLDAGSTTIQMVHYLAHKDVVVVTNSPSHVEVLMKYDIKTYLIGGLIKTKTNAVIGQQAIQSLDHYYFDKTYLGMNGFHPSNGYTTPDPEEAAVKRRAIQLARETFILVDSSKYKQTSFSKVTDLQNAKLITTNLNQNDIDQISQQTNIKVVDV